MKFGELLKQITPIWRVIVGVFLLGMVWSSLNYQIQANKEGIKKFEAMNIDIRLTEIQTDLKWLVNQSKKD